MCQGEKSIPLTQYTKVSEVTNKYGGAFALSQEFLMPVF